MAKLDKLHIDRALTNVSIAYIQSDTEFIADKVFKTIPVDKRSNKYYVFDSAQYLQSNVKKRASKSVAPKIELILPSTDQYYCEKESLSIDVSSEDMADQDELLDVEKESADVLARNFLIQKELKFAEAFYRSGVWGFEASGVEQSATKPSNFLYWDDPKSSPILNIKDAVKAIRMRTTLKPNTLVIGEPVIDALFEHPEIIARIIHGSSSENPAMGNLEIIKKLFNVENIIVSSAIYNTSPEGKFSYDNNRYICGGRSAFLCYVPKNAGMRTPSSGYSFAWNGIQNAMYLQGSFGKKIGDGTIGTKRYPSDERSCYVYETWSSYDYKVVGKELGFYFNNIIKYEPKNVSKS